MAAQGAQPHHGHRRGAQPRLEDQRWVRSPINESPAISVLPPGLIGSNLPITIVIRMSKLLYSVFVELLYGRINFGMPSDFRRSYSIGEGALLVFDDHLVRRCF